MKKALKRRSTAEAFNEWMRRYIKTPEEFEREFETVARFQRERRRGRQSYGSQATAYLAYLRRGH